MLKLGIRCGAYINFCASAGCKFFMSGDEVGVQMGFENVADFQIMLPRSFQIDFDISLRIHDYRLALGTKQVGGMRQTA